MKGFYRIDFLGGTLDLPPFYEYFPVIVVNAALQQSLEVILKPRKKNILWKRDQNVKEQSLKDLLTKKQPDLLERLLKAFVEITYLDSNFGLEITINGDFKVGSGLAGSSALAIAFLKALVVFFKKNIEMIQVAQSIEVRILQQGVAGFQDYYPAYYGGFLALKPSYGLIQREQLYTQGLIHFLKKNIVLAFSGVQRKSGAENWKIYKAFFDGDKKIRKALEKLAEISVEGYEALKKKNYSLFLEKVFEDGFLRKKTFLGFEPENITPLRKKIKDVKFCGAGGGGYFIASSQMRQSIYQDQIVEFDFQEPLDLSQEGIS